MAHGRIESSKVERVKLVTSRVCMAKEKEELIKFPRGTPPMATRYNRVSVKPRTCIGVLADKLSFAHWQGLGLLVWSLGEKRNEWALEHASNLEALYNLDPDPAMGKSILAFHPTLKVVYILYNGTVFSYELDATVLTEVRTIGVREAQGFSFSPLLFDAFED